MAKSNAEKECQEWLDAYWAKDILELFRLERRFSFMRFAELLFAQSGGMFEASRFSTPCEVSRTTISNYLSVLEATYAFHLLRPFSTHRPTEIVSAPKVYAFDTGFVCFYKGWSAPRVDDFGLLWEHFVLNELQAKLQTRNIYYWRDKSGHEVDFVLKHPAKHLTAVEAKWSASAFDPSSLNALRRAYPEGRNFVVCQDVRPEFPEPATETPEAKEYRRISNRLLAGSVTTLKAGQFDTKRAGRYTLLTSHRCGGR